MMQCSQIWYISVQFFLLYFKPSIPPFLAIYFKKRTEYVKNPFFVREECTCRALELAALGDVEVIDVFNEVNEVI